MHETFHRVAARHPHFHPTTATMSKRLNKRQQRLEEEASALRESAPRPAAQPKYESSDDEDVAPAPGGAFAAVSLAAPHPGVCIH